MCDQYNGKWINGTSFGRTTGSFHKGSKCSYKTKSACDRSYNWNFLKKSRTFGNYNVKWFSLPILFLNLNMRIIHPKVIRAPIYGDDETFKKVFEVVLGTDPDKIEDIKVEKFKYRFKHFFKNKFPPNFEKYTDSSSKYREYLDSGAMDYDRFYFDGGLQSSLTMNNQEFYDFINPKSEYEKELINSLLNEKKMEESTSNSKMKQLMMKN